MFVCFFTWISIMIMVMGVISAHITLFRAGFVSLLSFILTYISRNMKIHSGCYFFHFTSLIHFTHCIYVRTSVGFCVFLNHNVVSFLCSHLQPLHTRMYMIFFLLYLSLVSFWLRFHVSEITEYEYFWDFVTYKGKRILE